MEKTDIMQTKNNHISVDLATQLQKQQTINEKRQFIKKHEAEINAGKR